VRFHDLPEYFCSGGGGALRGWLSHAAATVAGFAAYLFAEGYSGGSDPQSVAPLAFPLSFLVLVVAGLPAALVCAVAWVGYSAVARKSRRPSV
jgi:drug/metabolite transporter (DMT)-like permease